MNRDFILGEEKEFKALMKLSVPATIAMLVNAIYNIIDTIFIGRGVGKLGIAGVSIYLPIQLVILSFALLIGVGTSSVISIQLGHKDKEGVNKTAGNLFFVMGVFSIITAIIGLIFTPQIVEIFGASEGVLPYATNYARTMFLGVFVFPICVASNNIIRAEGNAKNAMNAMIIGMIANVILDYLFIFVFKWGIAGAGLATSISKVINFIYIYIYFKKKSIIDFRLKVIKFNKEINKRVMSIGISAAITQLAISLVSVLLNYTLYIYGGNDALSSYGIINKLTLFIQMPLSGLVQGMQPIIGYNLGKKNKERIFNTVKLTLIISILVSVFFVAAVYFKADILVSMFTYNKELLDLTSSALKIVVLIYPILGIYLIIIGMYQSLGKGRESLILSLLRQIILFIPLSLILPHIFNLGILGIWLAFPISDLIAILITVFYVKKSFKLEDIF